MLLNSALTLRAFASELVLLFTVLLLLAGDLIFHPRDGRYFLGVTLGGLLLAAVAALVFPPLEPGEIMLAGLTPDTFAVAVKLLGFFFIALVTLLSESEDCCRSQSTAFYGALLLVAALVLSILGAASDLVLILLALDFLGVIAYIMTAYERVNPLASEAALKYFLYGATLSAVMLFGFSWLYGATGTTNLAGLHAFLDRGLTSSALPLHVAELEYVILPALIMAGAGFAMKLAAAPFHQWAPDAYQGAPTASAAFIAVIPKLAGLATLVRFTLTALPVATSAHGGDWQAFMAALASITMIVGSLGALWQTDLKRLLAYSGVAQVGYLLIGVVVQSSAGVAALLFYLVAYGVASLGVFAAIIAVTGNSTPLSTKISAFAGLHQRAPWVAFSVLVSLLTLIGMPLTAGFLGKFWLFAGALEAGFPWLTVIAVLSNVVSIAYYWKIIHAMYLQPAHSDEPLRISPWLAAALGISVALVILLGVFPPGGLWTLDFRF